MVACGSAGPGAGNRVSPANDARIDASDGASDAVDASTPSEGGSDALEPIEVGSIQPSGTGRHVRLYEGGPAQDEPSIAISSGVIGVAMRAGWSAMDNGHLRFGVATIGPDRTAGDFIFVDLPEPARAPRVESAGAAGFHVFWLTSTGGSSLRYAPFDLQGHLLAQPLTLGAAVDFDIAARSAGTSVAFATRVAQSFAGEEVRVGVLTPASVSAPVLASIETCTSASQPAVAWSGQAVDVYYRCGSAATSVTYDLRHARADASGALLGLPTTVSPGGDLPLVSRAAPPTLYWLVAGVWTKGSIDPNSGAVSNTGPAGFSATATARGIVRGREGTWALETSCLQAEDMIPRGTLSAHLWDAQEHPAGAGVAFSANGCDTPSVAGDGSAAFLAFGAGENAWLLPLGTPLHPHPDVIGRWRTVKPRRVHCDASWRCAVLIDEPRGDFAAGGPLWLPTGGWIEDPWRAGESSTLAWYTIDGGPSPSVLVVRSSAEYGRTPALADLPAMTGIGFVATPPPWPANATLSFVGLDGSVAWQVALPSSGGPYRVFDEGNHFRIFQSGLFDRSGMPVLGEFVVDATGVLSNRLLACGANWPSDMLTSCSGVYYAGGTSLGSILRYDPAQANAFSAWTTSGRIDSLGCGPHVVGALDLQGGQFGAGSVTVSRWSDDGTALPLSALGSWSPTVLALVPNASGFAWLAGGAAGAGPLSIVLVASTSVVGGHLPVPSSVQTVVTPHGESIPGSLSAIYCDDPSGDCWLSNWKN